MKKSDSLALDQNSLSEQIKQRLIRKRDGLRKIHNKQAKHERALSGRILAKMQSDIIDRLIWQALTQLGFRDIKNISILALGGYGRRELCPYSDIDLMFLYKKRNKTLAKHVTEKLLYLLWDLNLDVGHSVRTIDECMELSSEDSDDTTILTSLLDGRFIYGDRNLYLLFDDKLFRDLLPSVSAKFIRRKIKENENRLSKFGGSIYLLEPNVKEGEGGLRDINSALWIAQAKYKVKSFAELTSKGVLVEEELRGFEEDLGFLLLVRSELHYLAGRREDRLTFELQEELAKFLGFSNTKRLAIEMFMRSYYLRANDVRERSKRLIEKCTEDTRATIKTSKKTLLQHGFIIQSGVLSVTSPAAFGEKPSNLMRAFEYANRHGVRMSNYLEGLIRDEIVRITIDEKVISDPELNASFLRLLKTGKNVANSLFEMNRLRLLGSYIPEFGKIVCMVQHDAYHVYTVDVHSIMMIKEIENLLSYKYEKELPLLTKTAESLMNRHVLYLACLFHDMGKGEGRNHALKGAAMIPKLSRTLELSQKEGEQLELLVKHHMVMSHFSQRRDIHDYSLILRFARSVKTLEMLSLLYLLTFADIKSVGPNVWNNWKAMLLKELFVRTAKVLERGEFKKETPEDTKKRVTRSVVQAADGQIPEKKIRAALRNMPTSYFLGFSPRKIAYHVGIIEESKDGIGMNVLYYSREQYNEFTFWGFDEPGIFSQLCGVIRASGLNILGARITTRDDGRILDVFYVNRLGEMAEEQDPVWDKLRSNMREILVGKIEVEKLVAKRKKGGSQYRKFIPRYPTRVEIDNESSDKATIIDVYTYDRGGLLYDITKSITKLGLSTQYAKISTKVDQVVDGFYVTDMKGKKIKDSETIQRIKSELLNSIGN